MCTCLHALFASKRSWGCRKPDAVVFLIAFDIIRRVFRLFTSKPVVVNKFEVFFRSCKYWFSTSLSEIKHMQSKGKKLSISLLRSAKKCQIGKILKSYMIFIFYGFNKKRNEDKARHFFQLNSNFHWLKLKSRKVWCKSIIGKWWMINKVYKSYLKSFSP